MYVSVTIPNNNARYDFKDGKIRRERNGQIGTACVTEVKGQSSHPHLRFEISWVNIGDSSTFLSHLVPLLVHLLLQEKD